MKAIFIEISVKLDDMNKLRWSHSGICPVLEWMEFECVCVQVNEFNPIVHIIRVDINCRINIIGISLVSHTHTQREKKQEHGRFILVISFVRKRLCHRGISNLSSHNRLLCLGPCVEIGSCIPWNVSGSDAHKIKVPVRVHKETIYGQINCEIIRLSFVI